MEDQLNDAEQYVLSLAKGSTLVRYSGAKLFYKYWVEHSDGRVMTEIPFSIFVKLQGGFIDRFFTVTIPTNNVCRQFYKLKSEIAKEIKPT